MHTAPPDEPYNGAPLRDASFYVPHHRYASPYVNPPRDAPYNVAPQQREASYHGAPSREALLFYAAQARDASNYVAQSRDASLFAAQSRDASLFAAQSRDASLYAAQSRDASLYATQSRDASIYAAQSRDASPHAAQPRDAFQYVAKPTHNTAYPNEQAQQQSASLLDFVLGNIPMRNERTSVNNYGEKSIENYMNNLPNSNTTVSSQPTNNSWESQCNKEGPGSSVGESPVTEELKKKKVSSGVKEKVTCDICHKEYSNNWTLTIHIRTHTGEKPYPCDQCEKRFISTSDLKKHSKFVHEGLKRPPKAPPKKLPPVTCEVCNKEYTNKGTLTVHMRTHTGEKPFPCDLCEKRFISTSDLNKHKNVHEGNRSYHCNECGKSFTQSSYLTIHQRSHTGEMPYSCDVCSKPFTNQSALKKHKRIHTGEKPYVCDICEKAFSHSHTLHNHKMIHTGEKPFPCDQCDKTFRLKGDLDRHTKNHTGENLVSCDYCNKIFKRNSELKAHKRIHTGEKPYSCNLCGMGFSFRATWAYHMKTIETGEHDKKLAKKEEMELRKLEKAERIKKLKAAKERKLKKVLREHIKQMKEEPLFDVNQLTPEALLLLQKIKEEPDLEDNSDDDTKEDMVVNLNPDEMYMEENEKAGALVDNKDDIKKEILNEEDGSIISESNNQEKVEDDFVKNVIVDKENGVAKESNMDDAKDGNFDAVEDSEKLENTEANIKKEIINEGDENEIS